MLVIQDYYQLLGVLPNVTPEDLRRAYRRALTQNHLDHALGLKQKYSNIQDNDLQRLLDENIANTDARTKALLHAYEVLSNPTQRQAYDTLLIAQNYPGNLDILYSTRNLDFGDIGLNSQKSLIFWIYVTSGKLQSIHFGWRFHSPLPLPRILSKLDLGGVDSVQIEVTLIGRLLQSRRQMEALKIYCNRQISASLAIHYRFTSELIT